MELVYQNDDHFKNESIHNYGCRFRCLVAMAELSVNKSLSPKEIFHIYSRGVLDPFIMNQNCLCGTNEHKLIEYAFQALGYDDGKGRQIGSDILETGESNSWGGNKPISFTILHWQTQYRTGHFTLADKNGKEIFDPFYEKNPKNPYLKKDKVLRKLYYWIDNG